MLLIHFIVIMFVILAFVCVVQHFSNLYIYRKLHNQGADIKSAKAIAQNVSILMSIFYGILVFILICIAIQTFHGGLVI